MPPTGGPDPAAPPRDRELMRLLLVEDDDGDALLVEDLLDESALITELKRARTVDEALGMVGQGFDCVLLDLGLPDAYGLSALHALVGESDGAAIICLTGLDAEASGMEAVAAGAQDYLVKGQVDHDRIRRSIGYAVERRRAELQAQLLLAQDLQAAENARLERRLLPRPELRDPTLTVTTRYRPGRDAVLGGDFFDVIETDDGTVFVIIGDVTGHGPDEAALGVALRIAWRTLVLSGTAPDRLLPVLQAVLIRERSSEVVFTTACMAVIAPDRTSARVWLAGHHAPLLFDPVPHQLSGDGRGPMLGLREDAEWPGMPLVLGSGWRLVLFTDGWIEGKVGSGPERLGVSGLVRLASQLPGLTEGRTGTGAMLDRLLEQVEVLNEGPLQDDVAVLVIEHEGIQ